MYVMKDEKNTDSLYLPRTIERLNVYIYFYWFIDMYNTCFTMYGARLYVMTHKKNENR